MKKTVLITGATSGIGYELAKIFAHKKFNLVLVARSVDLPNLNDLKNNSDINIITIAQDLSEPGAAQKVFDKVEKQHITIDVLINNAGVGYHAAFLKSDLDRQTKLINLNITTVMQMSYLFGVEMQKRHSGKILNIASIAADLPGPYMSTYYASKSFVLSFSYALAEELRGSGVNVSTLCPGPVKTSFEKTASMKHTKMFSFLPANPRSIALQGYLMIETGNRLRFCGITTKLANILLKILPRFIAAKIAKSVDGNPD